MRAWKFILVLALAAGLASGLAAKPATPQPGQETKKAEAGKSMPGASQIVLGQWNEIGRKLIAMAEDFPEEKYDFKPTPEVRSFAEQMLHVSGSVYYFVNPAEGKTMPAENDPPRAKYKTKADIVAFAKKCVEDGAATIKAKGDKGMNEWISDPESKQQMHVSDLAYELIEHSGEHYGQLVMYFRLSGLVPPESRPKK